MLSVLAVLAVALGASTCNRADVEGWTGWSIPSHCTRLHLGDSGLTDRGARAIATQLLLSDEVEYVNATSNFLNGAGIKALTDASIMQSFLLDIDNQKVPDGLVSRTVAGGFYGATTGVITGAFVGGGAVAAAVAAGPLLAGGASIAAATSAVSTASAAVAGASGAIAGAAALGAQYGGGAGAALGTTAGATMASTVGEAKDYGVKAGAVAGAVSGAYAFSVTDVPEYSPEPETDQYSSSDSNIHKGGLFRDLKEQAKMAPRGQDAAHRMDLGWGQRLYASLCEKTVKCDQKTKAAIKVALNLACNYDPKSALMNRGALKGQKELYSTLKDAGKESDFWDLLGGGCSGRRWHAQSDRCQEWKMQQILSGNGAKVDSSAASVAELTRKLADIELFLKCANKLHSVMGGKFSQATRSDMNQLYSWVNSAQGSTAWSWW